MTKVRRSYNFGSYLISKDISIALVSFQICLTENNLFCKEITTENCFLIKTEIQASGTMGNTNRSEVLFMSAQLGRLTSR